MRLTHDTSSTMTKRFPGYFQPLVPVARAAVAAGLAVAVACAASFVPTVERAGFRPFPAGFDERGRSLPELFPGVFKETAAVRFWVLSNVFVGVYAVAMTPDLLTIAREWYPDLIVRETHEYGGCVAAEVLGIPHASIRTVSQSSQYGLRHHVAEALARLRELNGLLPDPDTERPFRYLDRGAERGVADGGHPGDRRSAVQRCVLCRARGGCGDRSGRAERGGDPGGGARGDGQPIVPAAGRARAR